MDREKIEAEFNRLLAENSEGFTIDSEGNEYREKHGYAVATRTTPYETLDEALDDVGPHQYIGYWKNPENGEEFIEVVDIIENGLAAIVTGLNRNQRAIYDFAKDEVTDLRGFYNETRCHTD